MTVFLAAPVMRVVARMLLPSTREETIRALLEMLNSFMALYT